MKLKSLLAALLIGAALTTGAACASRAEAATITAGDGWHIFGFGGTGSAWTTSFSFTLTGSAYLKVVDAAKSGDRFSVTGLGLTSIPSSTGAFTGDPDTAFADPAGRWSRAVFLLAAGVYNITGTVITSPFGGGVAYLELVAVPLPAALPLLGAALAGLGIAGRPWRRRQSAA